MASDWPKTYTKWIDNRVLYISIPFTWNLPGVEAEINQRSFEYDRAVIGGPAIALIPDFFKNYSFITTGSSMPGVMQRINLMATKTTTGCVNRCEFCAVPRIEGQLKELVDWPDLPVICDNNLLAASQKHFNRVIDRLKKHKGVDFNQGLDTRRLTDYHASRIAEIKGLKKRGIRLTLDNMAYSDTWATARNRLLSAGIAKRNISTYALIGFDSDPNEAWERCQWIEKTGVRVLPMWFHPLDTLKKNGVTEDQEKLGWNDYERRRIMQWFYQHKKAVD